MIVLDRSLICQLIFSVGCCHARESQSIFLVIVGEGGVTFLVFFADLSFGTSMSRLLTPSYTPVSSFFQRSPASTFWWSIFQSLFIQKSAEWWSVYFASVNGCLFFCDLSSPSIGRLSCHYSTVRTVVLSWVLPRCLPFIKKEPSPSH